MKIEIRACPWDNGRVVVQLFVDRELMRALPDYSKRLVERADVTPHPIDLDGVSFRTAAEQDGYLVMFIVPLIELSNMLA